MTKLPVFLLGIMIISIIPIATAEEGDVTFILEDTIVVLETNSGNIAIEFFPNDAPNHVENFVKLSNPGFKLNNDFYRDTIFHRIIPGFMIQGGDPNTRVNYDDTSNWGQGSPGYYIEAEFNDIKHKSGIVSMARSPDPNSAGSQFFIVEKDSTFLDGQYTVFGRLITQESFETLDKIASLQTDSRDIPIDREAAKIIQTTVWNRSDMNNLLELDPPERTSGFTPQTTNSGKYTDEELGFSFLPPIGWTIQNPDQLSSKSPAVAALGPRTGVIPAAFTVVVENNTASIDEQIMDLKQSIKSGIDSGVIDIINEEKTSHYGLDSYSITVTQIVENAQLEMYKVKIHAFLIFTSDKLYTLQFANTLASFEQTEGQFKDILDSFTILKTSTSSSLESIPVDEKQDLSINETQASEGGGCLIATAAYGSEMAPQVQFLREIRDNTVLQTQSGTSFMSAFNQFYYSFSPAVADYERENPVFKEAVKVSLTPLLTSLTILNYVDIDTEQEMLGYGIGIIMLNIGMYFVAPAVVIIALNKKLRK